MSVPMVLIGKQPISSYVLARYQLLQQNESV